jgi:N-acetylglutamate synthase-like GNAT family acetyltransferase
MPTIRPALGADVPAIYAIINDAAIAYKGIIPEDRWHEPYMPLTELEEQIAQGVVFFCYQDKENVLGVMGIQDRGQVQLIRHAYVRSAARGQGIGGKLLQHLNRSAQKPILIGTWAAASWAISFYEKHGFRLVSEPADLLRRYWNIPERQIETSVVLADRSWRSTPEWRA